MRPHPATGVRIGRKTFLEGGLALMLASSPTPAQTHDLSWFTANGAGAVGRTPVYGLEGTAGEAEAAVGQTEHYTLNSGFWAAQLADMSPAPPPPARINEWLIANHSTTVDPADGDYDGWIELLNISPSPILLGNWSLTDSLAQPDKFIFPGGIILPAAGSLLVWVDNEPAQAGLPPATAPWLQAFHANFTLPPGGGEIALFDDGLRLVDHVTYATQTENVSEGRFPNGAMSVYPLASATPGTANTLAPSTITVQPPEINALPGPGVEFCVEAIGSGPFAYQWRRNGVNLPGETNACLLIESVTVADGGSYAAVVSSPQGASLSSPGRLLVTAPEFAGANQFVNREPLPDMSGTISADNSGATREPGEPFHFGRFSSNSVWYSWTAPETGIARFDTRGSLFDTLLAVYQGNELSNLVEVVSDDDLGGSHTSQVGFNAVQGQRYEIVIDTLEGTPGPFLLTWSLEVTSQLLPKITRQPEGVTVQEEGQPAFFGVEASGSDLSYQWFRNGQPLPGKTSAVLTIPAVQIAHLGQYSVVVTGPGQRTVESLQASLEIGLNPQVQSRDKIAELRLPAPQPGGVGGAGGVFVPPAAGIILLQTLNNGGSTKDPDEPEHCRMAGGASRWFIFTNQVESICSIEVSSDSNRVMVAVYLEKNLFRTGLLGAPAACSSGTNYLEFPARAQEIYRMVVDTEQGAESTIHVQARYSQVSFDRLLATTNYFLKPRGSSFVLSAREDDAQENGSYQWQADGANLAGQTRTEMRLPKLEFRDARHYALCITNRDRSVVRRDACLGVIEGRVITQTNPRSFQLWGRTPALLRLDTANALGSQASWTTLLVSKSSPDNPNTPELWHSNATSISNVFYKPRPPAD